jgi:spermidine/putrescine-binding protein
MTTSLLTRPRTIVAVALLTAILAAGAYAFTASNTVPSSNAGAGSGAVSGYTATNVSYTLTAADPTTIDTLTFTVAPTTTSVVKVKAGTTGSWKTCVNSSGSITCDYSAAPISVGAVLDQLTVVAVQ